MADLPDWYTQIQSATLRATSIAGGLDADKSASPVAEDVWLARDTGILYACFVSGTWTNIGNLYLLLAGGTMSGALAMGSNKITGLAAPTANADAARKLDVDTVNAKLDDVTVSQPTRAIGTIYRNTSGKIMHAVIQVTNTTTAGTHVAAIGMLIGASSPPATVLGIAGTVFTVGVFYVTATFEVPPDYYYEVTDESSGGGVTALDRWTEWLEH